MRNEKGQILVGAIVLLVILAIMIPAMVLYVQNEARWSVKQGQNANAFQLAEAAVARGYQKVTESTTSWVSVNNGTALSGFIFDTSYNDLDGGTYTVAITSGPGSQVVTIIGIGRDAGKKEVRALSVVYANNPMSGNAIQSGGTAAFGGTNEIEWGGVASAKTITLPVNTKHPQFYSAANIVNKDLNGSSLPNTDGVQWWSYYPNIPPAPYIDFDFYKSSAIATGTCISESPADQALGCLHSTGNQCGSNGWWGGTNGGVPHSCSGGNLACQGKTWYIYCPTNGITITSNNNSYIVGNMIVIGNLDFQASSADGAPMASVPPTAWKQYGNDWAYWRTNFSENTNCTNRPPSLTTFPGLNSSYTTPASFACPLQQTMVHGFLYTSGNLTLETGGYVSVWGGSYVAGTANVASGGYVVYYDPVVSQNLITTRIVLTRTSWQDVLRGWPAALP